tara:strand:- start:245 stop:628 length:384 start_codon:yes stop_codon:yes gene_type:complete
MDAIEISMVGITSQTINPSLQVGDYVWTSPTNNYGGHRVANVAEAMEVGRLSKLEFFDSDQTVRLTVLLENSEAQAPSLGDFIYFAKNKDVNSVGPVGYYARVTMRNYDFAPVELFSVGCTIKESSK